MKQGHSEEEIYAKLVAYEKEEFGEFAYNPLHDFTETWYAYMLYAMLGTISEKELREYQKDYILRNDKAAARYYKILLEEV